MHLDSATGSSSGIPGSWPDAKSASGSGAAWFRAVTLILFAVVAAAVIIPTIHTGATTRQKVGVVAGSPVLDGELQKLASTVGLGVEVVPEPDPGTARAALTAGQLDMVVERGTILVENPVAESDTSAGARYLRAVATTLGAQNAFARAGLTPEQVGTVAEARPWPIDSVHPGKGSTTTAEATALLGSNSPSSSSSTSTCLGS